MFLGTSQECGNWKLLQALVEEAQDAGIEVLEECDHIQPPQLFLAQPFLGLRWKL